MEKGTGDGTGFIEQEESEPVVKKGKKFPWLIVGAVVIIGAAAVYFLVLNKKYALTVNLGEGCTGTPAATAKFKKNKAVAYNFTTQSGWGNLLVKLDGAGRRGQRHRDHGQGPQPRRHGHARRGRQYRLNPGGRQDIRQRRR